MNRPIPYYRDSQTLLGYRSLEAAERLLAKGLVTAVYGRKKHIKAIYATTEDGGTAVPERMPTGTYYSFRQHLETGNFVWALKKLGRGDELRPIFQQVVADCMAKS